MLMPPSVADWLPEDHLAWFVLDVVAELDLTDFYSGYRADGRGGAAYDPAVMLAVLVYAYCIGERSSRRIERRLSEDVAFRVVAANQQPDHATIARFRCSHETAIGALFGQVLKVCARQGLLRPGLVAIDGTRMVANASKEANRTAEQVAEQILAEAAAVDAGEDAEESQRGEPPRGPEGGVGPRAGRRARLRRVLEELQAEAAEHSYEAVMARRAAKEAETGKKIRGKKPAADRQKNRGRQNGNITDPDSRLMNTKDGFVQGFNAQAVATMDQFVIAAEVSNQAFDAPLYEDVIGTAKTNLKRAGEKRRVRRVVADAGYWSEHNVQPARGGVAHRTWPGPQAPQDRRDRAAPQPGHRPGPSRRARPSPRPPRNSGSRCPGSTRSSADDEPATPTSSPQPRSPRSTAPTDAGPTHEEPGPSSPSSPRSSTTARSAPSPAEASPPPTANGSSSAPPTTCSSSTASRRGRPGPRPCPPGGTGTFARNET